MVVKGKKGLSKAIVTPTETSISSSSKSTSESLASVLQGSGASPDDIKKAMTAMDNLLDSNFVDEYFTDDDRLENARLQLLGNLDQYEQMMPGFKEQARDIASDPNKWRQAMVQAREQIVKLKQQRDVLRAQLDKPVVPDKRFFSTYRRYCC